MNSKTFRLAICQYYMINNLTETSLFTQLQVFGTVVTLFGFTLVALMLRRKSLRRNIQGIHIFALTDRAPLSKRSENTLQKIGFLMVLAGIIAVTADAVRKHEQPVDHQQEQIINT